MKHDNLTETIRFYERITAGRFYDKAQREKLFEFSAKANFISESQADELRQVIFSPDVEDCALVQDCENGLLFEMVFENRFIKDVLENRLKTLISLTTPRGKLWEDRFEWITYLSAPKTDYKRVFESATFEFANGNCQKALNQIEQFAKSCDIDSVKFVISASNALKNKEKELEYLLLYSRLLEELYFTAIPAEITSRIKKLSTKKTEQIVQKVKGLKLKYFDEYGDGSVRMGF